MWNSNHTQKHSHDHIVMVGNRNIREHHKHHHRNIRCLRIRWNLSKQNVQFYNHVNIHLHFHCCNHNIVLSGSGTFAQCCRIKSGDFLTGSLREDDHDLCEKDLIWRRSGCSGMRSCHDSDSCSLLWTDSETRIYFIDSHEGHSLVSIRHCFYSVCHCCVRCFMPRQSQQSRLSHLSSCCSTVLYCRVSADQWCVSAYSVPKGMTVDPEWIMIMLCHYSKAACLKTMIKKIVSRGQNGATAWNCLWI